MNFLFGGIKIKQNKILIIFIITLVFIFCGAASAATVKTNQVNTAKITNNGSMLDNGGDGAIDGKRIVWKRIDGYYAEYDEKIIYKNLETGKEIIIKNSTGNPHKNADISGTRVVWSQQNSENQYCIYIKNLETGYSGKIFTTTENQKHARISNTRVVWQQEISRNKWAIYYKNLLTGSIRKVKVSTKNQYNPYIYGSRIVWTQDDSVGHSVIYIKNLVTGYCGRVYQTKQNQDSACVSDKYIVWQQANSLGNFAVYYKSLLNHKTAKVFSSPDNQTNPSISGSRVVWEQNSLAKSRIDYNQTSSIYYRNFAISNSLKIVAKVFDYLETDDFYYNLSNPDISGTRVIWEEFRCDDQSAIYWIYYKNI